MFISNSNPVLHFYAALCGMSQILLTLPSQADFVVCFPPD